MMSLTDNRPEGTRGKKCDFGLANRELSESYGRTDAREPRYSNTSTESPLCSMPSTMTAP